MGQPKKLPYAQRMQRKAEKPFEDVVNQGAEDFATLRQEFMKLMKQNNLADPAPFYQLAMWCREAAWELREAEEVHARGKAIAKSLHKLNLQALREGQAIQRWRCS